MKNNYGRPSSKLLAEVAAAEAHRCSADSNIDCVGFGLKFVNGRPTMRAALQYHVFEKFSSEDEIRNAGSEPVPTTVDGYDTDVLAVQINVASACPDSKSPTGERGGRKEDPLVGGTSATVLSNFHSFPTGYGTLGGICFDSTTGSAMALSNAHVFGSDIGNDAIQPWLPTSEYLEAAVKYLLCGGPLSHLFFWTAPSPLTAILTMAATTAFLAAIASDAEDPSRWGQRTGTVPPAGTKTERERVRLSATVPPIPFPGRHWTSRTGWDYSRITSSGTTSTSTVEDRSNEHVLVGKRVITDRAAYLPGNRVTICAQLFTRVDALPIERYVVANCFRIADPERMVRRVLTPGDEACARLDHDPEKTDPPICVRGFLPQVKGLKEMVFPIRAEAFVLFSDTPSTVLHLATSPNNPSGVDAVTIPGDDLLKIVCPPSTHVELIVYHFNKPIQAVAYSANGSQADLSESTGEQGISQTIKLSGPEIVRVELKGGGGEGFLAGICVDKLPIDVSPRRAHSRYYTGYVDLDLNEPPGEWAVVVVSQTLDDTPTGGDPIRAARRLSGIVDSANVVETRECACTMLHDHTFLVT